jgi:hypothetical protein
MKKQAFSGAAIWAAGLMFLLILLNPLSTPARTDEGDRAFVFLAYSQAATIDGVQHRIAMLGSGTFNAAEREVEGGGSFVHFDQATPGVPKRIISSGLWKAREFVSYQNGFGITYGHIESAILVVRVDLIPDGGGEVVQGVTLRLICNTGPAGVTTGEPEGFVLTIPGTPFGPFKPLDPILGITHLSTAEQDEDRSSHRSKKENN